MTMLSVTVTPSPLMTGDPFTSIDTVSTGGLAALGVQFRVKEVPVVRRVGLRGVVSSGRSAGRAEYVYTHTECNGRKCLVWNEGSHCTSRVKLAAPLPASL